MSMSCYYHGQLITHFCSFSIECTLPLCKQCVSVHRRDAKQQGTHSLDQHLITIEQAQHQASQWAKHRKLDYTRTQRILDKKLDILRSDIIHQLDEELAIVKKDYLMRVGALGGYEQMKDKQCLIRSRSLKQIIKTFENKLTQENKVESLQQVKALKIKFNYNAFRRSVGQALGLGVSEQSYNHIRSKSDSRMMSLTARDSRYNYSSRVSEGKFNTGHNSRCQSNESPYQLNGSRLSPQYHNIGPRLNPQSPINVSRLSPQYRHAGLRLNPQSPANGSRLIPQYRNIRPQSPANGSRLSPQEQPYGWGMSSDCKPYQPGSTSQQNSRVLFKPTQSNFHDYGPETGSPGWKNVINLTDRSQHPRMHN